MRYWMSLAEGFSVYLLLGFVSPVFEDKVSVIEGHLLGM
jgi:hypothetical protein